MQETPSIGLFTGKPAFPQPLHVGRPNIGNRDQLLKRINGMLDRRWLSNNGPLVQEFEKEIAGYLGVRNAVCVCNATVGMEVAIRAANISGEVIVPAYTFVATAHAVQWQGFTPIFADVDGTTHNLDPANVERHITPRTTGILATHVWGRPAPIAELESIARRHKLRLIFDAAHAFGCSYRGRMIGGFGDAEVFSFHATKFLNSFEGGAICTNDDALAKKIRLMINFGFAGFDNVVELGTNAKMTESSAAMGLTSLEGIAGIVAANRANYTAYRQQFSGIRGLAVMPYDESEHCNYQYVVCEVDPELSVLNRDELVRVLHLDNVLARKYFWPGVHRMEPYRTLYPESHLHLSETERMAARVMVLPTGTAVSTDDIARITDIVRTALASAGAVKRRLSEMG